MAVVRIADVNPCNADVMTENLLRFISLNK